MISKLITILLLKGLDVSLQNHNFELHLYQRTHSNMKTNNLHFPLLSQFDPFKLASLIF